MNSGSLNIIFIHGGGVGGSGGGGMQLNLQL